MAEVTQAVNYLKDNLKSYQEELDKITQRASILQQFIAQSNKDLEHLQEAQTIMARIKATGYGSIPTSVDNLARLREVLDGR